MARAWESLTARQVPNLNASKITSNGSSTSRKARHLHRERPPKRGVWRRHVRRMQGRTLSLTGGIATVTQASGDEFSFLITEVNPNSITSFFDSGVTISTPGVALVFTTARRASAFLVALAITTTQESATYGDQRTLSVEGLPMSLPISCQYCSNWNSCSV